MASYNRIIIVGNLTRDPELKQLTSGQGVCRLGLASNREFKNRQTGASVQEVCYVDVDVWGPQADSCHKYLQKGRPVLIEGRLKLDTWQDQNGQNRSKHLIVADRVVFLSSGAGAQTGDFASMQEGTESNSNDFSARVEPQNPVERELLNQIDSVKKRKRAAAPAGEFNANVNQGGMSFKDEPPFQDDLPF